MFTSWIIAFLLGSTSSHLARADGENDGRSHVNIYFGNGCFWARQHLFVKVLERDALKRNDSEISAIAGYAGSSFYGANRTLCYHNSRNFSDYGAFGHAEVVQLQVPHDALVPALSTYFNSFVESSSGVWDRADYFDQGAEYRSLIGFPGGLDNADIVAALHEANVHNMTLQRSVAGADGDSFGTNSVYVMDSMQFPFTQAERCLQFHDDQIQKYPESYHALRSVLEANGKLAPTACPANLVCNSSITEVGLQFVV